MQPVPLGTAGRCGEPGDQLAARDREVAHEVVVGGRAREVGERRCRGNHGAKRSMAIESV